MKIGIIAPGAVGKVSGKAFVTKGFNVKAEAFTEKVEVVKSQSN